MRSFFRVVAATLGLALGGAASAQDNLLANPSFEQSGALANGWSAFGNVFREQLIPVTGSYSIKMFGNFQSSVNYSGLFQDHAAASGQEWTVNVTGTNPAFDAMQGGNRALLKVEFYDANDTLVGSGEAEVLTAMTPAGAQQPASVTTAAPAGTTRARIILLFEQLADNAAGSAFFDDVSATIFGSGSVAIVNPSFESGSGVIPGWSTFNNAIQTGNGPRTGAGNLTLTSGVNSGVFQEFSAIPGSVWEASVWGQSLSTSNPLVLPDFALLNIEWRDAGNNLISFETTLLVDGLSPQDTYLQATVGGTAPEGTAKARMVIIYIFGGGSGTVQVDDASFVRVSSPPPAPTGNLLNNPGFELALGFDFSNTANWNGFFGGPAGTFLQAFNNTGATPRSGNNALVTTIRRGTAADGFNSFTGHVQTVSGILPGQVYELSVWARANPIILDGAEFRVEWRGPSGELSRFNSPIQGQLTSEYQQFVITDTAPEGATQALIVLAVQSFTHTGLEADTSVAWDDVFFGPPAVTCPRDFNNDGDVNPDDLGDYINCYFSAPPCAGADVNDDGEVNPDDLGDYINIYFGGC